MDKVDYLIGDDRIEIEPTKDETAMIKLKKIRKTYGMTQKEISDMLEIPLDTWQQWERGRREPPKYMVRLISYALEYKKMNEKNIL